MSIADLLGAATKPPAKKAKVSPTQRSLKHWRGEGYECHITEHYNWILKQRKDLFGFCDILALGDNERVAIQTTSYTNISARVKKIKESPNLPAVKRAGFRVIVEGWKAVAPRKWEAKRVEL